MKWLLQIRRIIQHDGDNDGDGDYNDDDGIFGINLGPLYLNLCIKNVIDAVPRSLIRDVQV